LRRDEVDERPGGVYLTLDRRSRHRLRLAERVGDLIVLHLVGAAGDGSPWVLPGSLRGRPASEGLRQRLGNSAAPVNDKHDTDTDTRGYGCR